MEQKAEEEISNAFPPSSFSSSDLKQLLHSLPSNALNHFFSLGVCVRCILRLFGIKGPIYASIDNGSVENPVDSTTSNETKLCNICLGILQFRFYDDKEKRIFQKDTAYDVALLIADMVRQDGYQFDSFSLEVSIPPLILQNEASLWSYMQSKYGSEPWFREKIHTGCVSIKDALKFSLINPLEKLLDCKSSLCPFRIRLTYTHTKASEGVAKCSDNGGSCKRRKTGESDSIGEGTLSSSVEDESFDFSKLFPKSENEPCNFSYNCSRTPFYFGGRYLKYSRNVSQTRWIIDDERMGEASVEEIIGIKVLQACGGDNYKFHAAGREDIDVRMLGPGRPFILEVQNTRLVPTEQFANDIEKMINKEENKLVRVNNLKLVGSDGWNLMREGEGEKQKQYAALVWTSRPLKDEDFQQVSSLKDLKVAQRTPIRVLHRRSPLEREKIIHWMKMETVAGSSQYFLLHLCTQAGTYIKEFVHGDLGRTHPSIGSILGCRAEILQLDVTDIKMECFLT
ncbi:hypothetical protein PIB30_044006 [Stylosanthes scabra]|uniref:tRNA pseudouridine(55) synthase n=2 Tax=Stylosanthes scabra TaxID=79078 RepID=A0ABU6WE33_9FABA|nr:hypothetical protein [Stylosanthes scabra]